MKAQYHFIDHTADILFRAEAPSLPELFEQCALALEETQVDVPTIDTKQKIEIRGENKTVEGLLFDFLDDLVYYKDAERLVFRVFQIKIEQKGEVFQLLCTAAGETLDVEKHHPKVDVKAVTMHLFEVVKIENGWKAQVLLDI